MRPMILTRIHRRCIVKYFGSCKNLSIWVLSVLFTVFLLDSYVLNGVVQKSQSSSDGSAVELRNSDGEVATRNTSCGQATSCPIGQYSYLLKSGVGSDGQPTICFNGYVIFSPEKQNGKRGINLVKINGKSMNVEDVRTFDTHENDEILQRYLKLGVDVHDVVLLSSANEASLHLSSATKQLMKSFGSEFTNNLEFRDAFVMIGQQNLVPPSKAIEQLIKRQDGEVYAGEAFIEGCLSIPLGITREANKSSSAEQVVKVERTQIEDKVKLGDYWINCGLPENCPDDLLPVHIYTGNKNIELPKVCFRGRYVIANDLNDPGRGIAVISIDSNSGAVLDVQRFDTYESAEKSTKLEEFLMSLKNNEIIIALAHDEAKTALSIKAMDLLTSFGSNFIKELGFRDVWSFVGRAGLKGFTPYEDIEPAGKDSWPYSISSTFCMKKNFKGEDKKIDLSLKKNILRRNFCKTYDGYEDFCSAQNIDEHPKILPLSNKTFEGPLIYKTPIVLIPGLSQISTVKQLEALFTIPGLDLNYVVMMCDEKFEESRNIASLFNVTIRQLKSSTKYINLVRDALDLVWIMFPTAKHAIFLEEEVIPRADILSFFGQLLDVLDEDDSLVGVTAFNEHGFEGHSQRQDLVYRGETFPGSGFMLKKSFYGTFMVNNMLDCCSVRSWFGWKLPEGKEMLIPDVSRTIRREYLGLTEHAEFIRDYFNKPRKHSMSKPVELANVSNLKKSAYDSIVGNLIKDASIIPHKDLEDCVRIPGLKLTKGTHLVYFERSADNKTFEGLCRCFNLLYSPNFKIRGMHQNTLRFTYLQSEVILIEEKSPFYKMKPMDHQPFKLNQMTN